MAWQDIAVGEPLAKLLEQVGNDLSPNVAAYILQRTYPGATREDFAQAVNYAKESLAAAASWASGGTPDVPSLGGPETNEIRVRTRIRFGDKTGPFGAEDFVNVRCGDINQRGRIGSRLVDAIFQLARDRGIGSDKIAKQLSEGFSYYVFGIDKCFE